MTSNGSMLIASEPRRPIAMLVDDDPSIRRVLARVFEQEGWHTLEANDAEEALLLLERAPDRWPAVVISDVGMPRADGIYFAEGLDRRVPDFRGVIVFHTGTVLPDDTLRRLRRVAAAVLLKPHSHAVVQAIARLRWDSSFEVRCALLLARQQ